MMVSRSASRDMPMTAEAISAVEVNKRHAVAPNFSRSNQFPKHADNLLKFFNGFAHGVDFSNARVDKNLPVAEHKHMVKAALKVVYHVSR